MVATVGLTNGLAATIVQLLNQLERQGYAADDRRLLRRAYEFVAPLYSCQYRSSGRTMIDHTVGTTGIVAALAVRPPLLIASLLHDIYLHGDFGTRLKRVGQRKRARVRQAVGDAVEELVYRYAALEWSARTIPAIGHRLPALDPLDRQVVLLRLADQLDIYGTTDALYSCNLAQRRELARDCGPVVVAMADDLGLPALSAALAGAYSQFSQRTLPAGLASPAWKDGVNVPRSYAIRPSIALYQRARAKVWVAVGR